MDSGPLDEIVRRNREVSDLWEQYAPHRARVMRLLLAEQSPPGRLCVAGAGNSNDLDLAALVERFTSIELVDFDGEALARGVARQLPASAPQPVVRGGIELTGACQALVALSRASPAARAGALAALEQAIARGPPLEASGRFDVVCSLGLLSQLVDLVARALKADEPARERLVLAVRTRHLQALVEWLAPAGRLWVVSDFVSSATAPALAAAADGEIPRLAAELLRQRNFFTGLNPLAIAALLTNDSWFARRLDEVRVAVPWRWWVTDRAFAVTAISARRRSA